MDTMEVDDDLDERDVEIFQRLVKFQLNMVVNVNENNGIFEEDDSLDKVEIFSLVANFAVGLSSSFQGACYTSGA